MEEEIQQEVDELFGDKEKMPDCQSYVYYLAAKSGQWWIIAAAATRETRDGDKTLDELMLDVARGPGGDRALKGLMHVVLSKTQPRHELEFEGLASLFG